MYKQDFQPEYQNLVDQLSVSLNNGIESVYTALTNNISLKDNVNCTVKDISVAVDANGIPTIKTVFTVTNTNLQILGTQVIYALNTTNAAVYPTGGIFISYTQTSNGVLVNHITGLPAGNTFTLRVVAYGQ